MNLKTLHLTSDLYENVIYDEHSIPLVTCIDNFDEYIGRQWHAHWHEGFEFTTVLSGECQYEIHNNNQIEAINLQPGDSIFINTGVLHGVRALTQNTQTACFVLPPTFFESRIFSTLKGNSVYPVSNSGIKHITWHQKMNPNQSIATSIVELCKLKEDEIGYELHSVAIVCQIWRLMLIQFNTFAIDTFNKGETIQVQRVKNIIQFIHQNYRQAHLTVDDMAQSVCISRAECFRSFKTVLNQTPIEYLIDYRMAMAEMLLTTTQRTIKEIGQMCGFQSASYFGSQFRKRYHLTPKMYKENHLS